MWRLIAVFPPLSVNFYSHIPCGMWLFSPLPSLWLLQISTHTSRVGCDLLWRQNQKKPLHFYSHIPCGMWRSDNTVQLFGKISTHTSRVGCDEKMRGIIEDMFISTHTSRVGCDIILFTRLDRWFNFYSHIPCGMWQKDAIFARKEADFYSHIPCGMWLELEEPVPMKIIISTHTSRVGCDIFADPCIAIVRISTHTSRVGCDVANTANNCIVHGISTHTSRVGCDISRLS